MNAKRRFMFVSIKLRLEHASHMRSNAIMIWKSSWLNMTLMSESQIIPAVRQWPELFFSYLKWEYMVWKYVLFKKPIDG